MKNKAPFFSVVIPSLNEAKYLPKLLEDFTTQSFTDFEVIHIDAQSEDDTIALTKKYSSKFALSQFSVKKRNVSYQRNFGSKKAKGEWLLFMDADNRIPTHFLLGVRYQLDRFPECEVFTNWLNRSEYPSNDRTLIDLYNLGVEFFAKVKPMSAGAFIGVRRKLTKDFKFNEAFYHSEDLAFIQHLTKSGHIFKVFKDPQYTTSLRRFKKDGTIKMLRIFATMNIQYVMGITDQNKDTYPMEGGKYYDELSDPLLKKLDKQIRSATKKQLSRLKEMMSFITFSE